MFWIGSLTRKKFLEDIDKMLGHILQELSKSEEYEFSICVTGDHSTPVLAGDHSYQIYNYYIIYYLDHLTG